jgi:hypothetical protein
MKAFYMRINDDNKVMMMNVKTDLKQTMKSFLRARTCASRQRHVNGDKQSGSPDDDMWLFPPRLSRRWMCSSRVLAKWWGAPSEKNVWTFCFRGWSSSKCPRTRWSGI